MAGIRRTGRRRGVETEASMQAAVVAVGLWMLQVATTPATPVQSAAQDTTVNQSFGPEIQFDTKGVEFGPWIRRFVVQVKRNWQIPWVAMSGRGHVVITFNVQESGLITDVTVQMPATVAIFNDYARWAIVASSPTMPLPSEYPATQAFFTVTFYYNELPREIQQPPFEQSASSLLATTALDVEQRLGKPTQVKGHRWTYATEHGVLWVYFDDAEVVIDVQPRGFDLTIVKK